MRPLTKQQLIEQHAMEIEHLTAERDQLRKDLDAALAVLTAYQQEPFEDAPERDAIEDGMLPWSQRRWRCRLGFHAAHIVDIGKHRPPCEHCGKFFTR